MKILLENLLENPVFHTMVDHTKARAASNRIMNGLTVELRIVGDDLIYGYEGLSFSGCNIWAYSTKKREGYITFSNDEEQIYTDLYSQFPYTDFDTVPAHTQEFYRLFLKNYNFTDPTKAIAEEYRGAYHRVKINEKELEEVFHLAENHMIIRNPEEIRYELLYINNNYHIQGKDKVQGAAVRLYTAQSGNHYLLFDGTLYKKINN